MKFEKRNKLKEVPSVGDLVRFEGEIYLLIYDEEDEEGYPYLLLSLVSGKVKNGLPDMETVNMYCELVTRNEDLKLIF